MRWGGVAGGAASAHLAFCSPPPPLLPLRISPRSAVEVWHLQRVLAKKRDPLSHTLFLDVVAPGEEDPLPLDRFW